MRQKKMKALALLLVLGLVATGLGGCASSTGKWQNAKTGGLLGALGGAVVGFAKNGVKGALIGAAIGGAAGAAIGGMVDYYKQKNAPEVYSEYGRRKQVKIENMALSKGVFKGGEKGKVDLQYVVVNPDPGAKMTVNHTIAYYQGNKLLTSHIESKSETTGGYKVGFPLDIPKGADEGEYKVVAKVSAMGQEVAQERDFRVLYARDENGRLRVASIAPY